MYGSALLHAAAAILLWSTLAWLGLALKSWPPFLLVGCALLLGSLCSLHRIREWRVRPAVVALGIYGLFGFHFLLFMALRLAPPVEANLINYLWPLLIVLLAPLILTGYRLRLRHIAAGMLGFIGAGLLVTGGTLHLQPAHALGYALALGSACIWATYSLATKPIGAFPTATIGLFCFVSGALSIVAHLLFEPRYVPSAAELPYLLALGLGPMGAAFFLWDAALKRGDPRAIGSLAYLTPMLSTLLLVATGHGRLTSIALAAMALIIGGAALGSLPARARPVSERSRIRSGTAPGP